VRGLLGNRQTYRDGGSKKEAGFPDEMRLIWKRMVVKNQPRSVAGIQQVIDPRLVH
jgi:hypothetical protein